MASLVPWKKHDRGVRRAGVVEPPSRQDVVHEMARFRDDCDAMLNQVFGRSWLGPLGMSLPMWTSTSMLDWNGDWEDREHEYVCQMELPGLELEDFDVRVSGDTLTVHAEHREETPGQEGSSSYRYGAFSRTVTLPHGGDGEKIDARYHSGVLEVH